MQFENPDIGLISNIQKYSTKDGPGNRNTVFLKGCSLNCQWCSNPELIRPHPELLYTRAKCISCGLCIDVCPHDAISYDDDDLIVVDREKCVGAGECVEVCPEDALELVGKEISVDELASELMKDDVFYKTSGGGVTFSGGEPLCQPGFVRKAAHELKRQGIHTALDTAGSVPWSDFEEVLKEIDLVLYDLKTMDRDLHKEVTGHDNDLVLENARKLAKQNIPIHMRLVVIPEVNDSMEDLTARMEFITSLENVEQIDLLPYHRYGVGKYERFGMDYPLGDIEEYSDEQVEEMRAHIAQFGIPVKVGG
jgi:pyruvate formate lyase activating enzyme